MISPTRLTISEFDVWAFEYSEPNGQFFVYDRPSGSISGEVVCCREEAFWAWQEAGNSRYVGFSAPNLSASRLDRFFRLLTPNLPRAAITVFKTNVKDTVICAVPHFWRANGTRQGFFTLFLRCGAIYFKTSVRAALKEYELTANIPLAIRLFLKGHTNIDEKVVDDIGADLDGDQMVDSFGLLEDAEIRAILVK